MKLSILDQAPISSNQTPAVALQESVKLAKAGEDLGFTRYWIAEHHDLAGLACSAPEVMLGYIGAHTKSIRIGSGAVLLPHYKPYKVAELYNTLATLFPNRIDIGIGRAPGGSAEVTNALSDNFLQNVFNMPTSVVELLQFINGTFPKGHKYSTVRAAPVPETPPEAWLLGTSKKSAELAAENGMFYAFGLFMSDNDGKEIIELYRKNFVSSKQEANVILTVSVICSETNQKAEEIALSSLVWKVLTDKGEGRNGVPSAEEAKSYPLTQIEKGKINNMKDRMIVGNPVSVKEQLLALQKDYNCDEIMVVTITHDANDRLESYRLLSRELL
ncbi:hypothetical protein JCM9140_4409 [Halalkalibacter wakoensis JCM 9140]|uniref:Luciferase-like domain-containing protein n=1 Tax=Halalkalibacter wakoensis JCM 9140 TaxID=1236970 RepID=W4Q896_9BACI|nr:LLM class flavin-dependent oxidoreductase [Halalkalibacter wakoensis]GAE28200.1 hypothetical protein JCM9140_4409 [Halalkalibacter wakoensis JCM 9140]